MKKLDASHFILLSIAVVFGAAIPVLLPGIAIKLALPVLGVLIMTIAWAARSAKPINQKVLFATIHAPTIALSIVWPRYLFLHLGGLPGINPFTILAMVSLSICIFALVKSEKLSKDVAEIFNSGNRLSWLAITWLMWRLITSITGELPIASTIEYIKDFLYIGAFFVVGLVAVADNRGPDKIFKIIILCTLLVDCIGVYEYITLKNPFFRFITETPDGATSKALASIISDKIRDGTSRAQSVFDHPIVFAQFCAAVLPIGAFAVRHGESKTWKLAGLAMLALTFPCVAITGSRAGIVSVGAAIFVLFLIWWIRSLKEGRVSRIIAILTIPALVLFLALLWLVLNQLIIGRNQHEASSTMGRLGMIKSGVAALWDNPILGFGYGSAVFKAGVVNTFGIPTIDNYFLSVAVDSGYVGLLMMVILFIGFWIKSIGFAANSNSRAAALSGACGASSVALATSFAGLSIYQNMTLFWILIACGFSSWTTLTDKK